MGEQLLCGTYLAAAKGQAALQSPTPRKPQKVLNPCLRSTLIQVSVCFVMFLSAVASPLTLSLLTNFTHNCWLNLA